MFGLNNLDRDTLLNLTSGLTMERKAEIIYLYCVRGEEIEGDDSWHIAELAALYGINVPEERLRNCYSNTYTFREIYNLMITYPHGLDYNVRFEDEISNISLNKYKYINKAKMHQDVKVNSYYDKYDRDFEDKEEYDPYPEIKMPTNRTVAEVRRNFMDNMINGIACGLALVYLGACTYEQHFEYVYTRMSIWNLSLLDLPSILALVLIAVVVCVVVFVVNKLRFSKGMFIIFAATALIFTIFNVITFEFIGIVIGIAIIVMSVKNYLRLR